MRQTTIKVAELATIIYAFLVLLSLLIDTAYYSQFNIRIVSYMTITEILLSCLERFNQYMPAILVTGITLIIFLWVYIDPFLINFYRSIWKRDKSNNDKDAQLSELRINIFFGERRSIHAKFSVVAKYNLFAYILPLLVVLVTALPYMNIIDHYSFLFAAILLIPLILYVGSWLFIFDLFYSVYDKNYDWSKYPMREQMYTYDKFRQKVAPHRFSASERKMVQIIYKYRLLIISIIFLLSLFSTLCLTMFLSGKEIKDNGNNYCVVIKCGDEIIDTRVQNLDYIGESARCIFIYDRATKGTRVVERSAVDSYLCFKSQTFNNNLSDENSITPEYHYLSLIQDSILSQMEQVKTSVVCDYYFDSPNLHYQLVHQNLNHFIWVDTVNHTYLEQITMPKHEFATIPNVGAIFNLERYIKDKDRVTQYGYIAEEQTYSGCNGEIIKTLVCGGRNYTAWLFCDPYSGNLQQGDNLFKSIKEKYTILEQIKIRYQNLTMLDKILFYSCSILILAFFTLICLVLTVKRPKHLKETEAHILSIILILALGALVYYSEHMFNPFGNTAVVLMGVFVIIEIVLYILIRLYGKNVFRCLRN